MNTYFVEVLLKAASENIYFQQPAKSKNICPKLGNFEHKFQLFPEVFRSQSNIYNGGSFNKKVSSLAVNYFCKRSFIIDVQLGSKYTADSIHPPDYFSKKTMQTS